MYDDRLKIAFVYLKTGIWSSKHSKPFGNNQVKINKTGGRTTYFTIVPPHLKQLNTIWFEKVLMGNTIC